MSLHDDRPSAGAEEAVEGTERGGAAASEEATAHAGEGKNGNGGHGVDAHGHGGALAGTSVDEIKDATEKLVGVSQSFSQRLYEQASATASAGSAGPSGDGAAGEEGTASDDEVVDAEIVDEQ